MNFGPITMMVSWLMFTHPKSTLCNSRQHAQAVGLVSWRYAYSDAVTFLINFFFNSSNRLILSRSVQPKLFLQHWDMVS